LTERKHQRKEKTLVDMHWAINITKAIDEPEDITLENIQTLIENITDEIMKKMPYGVSTLKHLERKSAAFGPFERPTHARTMPASDLDEEHKDFFGNQWAFLALPMVFKEFHEPVWTVRKVFVCSTYPECTHHQNFKGSCTECKSKGIKFVPTIEVRDWDRRFA